MAVEIKGYLLRVTFAADATLTVHAKSKQPFGTELPDKIDVTTDLTIDNMQFEPGFLPELTDATLEVSHDFDEEVKFRAIIGTKGDIVFTSTATGKSVTYPNAWVKSYTPDDAGLNDQPTATITLESAGGTAGTPVVAVVP